MNPTNPEPSTVVPVMAHDPRGVALEAMARVAVEPTGIVRFATSGGVLVIGEDEHAVAFAAGLPHPLKPMVALLDAAAPVPAPQGLQVFEAQRHGFELEGHLGDFRARLRQGGEMAAFDLVVDFSSPPLFEEDWSRLGYHAEKPAPGGHEELVRALVDEVGEFEKPRFFRYDPDLCVRGRSGLTGCNRCVQACPAGAITGLAERIEVDPYLCQGGGICATVCPGGALQYTYPGIADSIERLRRLVQAFGEAGGSDPELLIHDGESVPDIASLPQNLLPYAVEEVPAVGMEFWLTALAFGIRAVHLDPSRRLAADSRRALEVQLSNTSALLEGLGFPPGVVGWHGEGEGGAMPAIQAAAYGAPGDKREILFMALDHLVKALADAAPEVVALPASAPLGEILVDANRCTLCVSCATVCPRGAVTAEEGRPALVFFEARCVQCGLCEQACPEHAITLGPRLVTAREQRDRRRVLHEEAPFECIRCGKPFATRSSIEGVLARLEGHSMFDGDQQRQRLRMCGDCRVIDMMQEGGPM